jgi:hypothetical protein
MTKDFLGNEIKPGDYFAYPLTIGRSAQMALFQYVQENASGTHKARPIMRSYGYNSPNKYRVFDYKDDGSYGYRDMTAEERAKVDGKTSTLHFLDQRAVLLKDYTPTA